jgi:hypothetical protein
LLEDEQKKKKLRLSPAPLVRALAAIKIPAMQMRLILIKDF